MTANSTEAETDKAIPLDKLSSRVGDQTGREGYVVFVLNIGRMVIIFNTYTPTIVGAAAGCDLLILNKTDQKIAACGSSYMDGVRLSGFCGRTQND
ncbi:hypothetical protein J3D48_004356 [Pseudomonas fluorescens]|uniref:hypothetical protein n=1 Tax=Pseudomonas fluorescens TaxID=294 RepID=UPI0013CE3E99|nr:hypothetical protein [Pseudomonas fluorescens]MCP1488043.1 hypothetical protein [Pseudomonas fluorescens]